MAMLVADSLIPEEILAVRKERGLDLYDEVWEGMYVMHAIPNDEHQDIVNELCYALTDIVRRTGLGIVRPGVNLASDATDWRGDYRCPDVVAFLNTSNAVCHGTSWTGGPDFAVEILSPQDKAPSKVDF